MSLKVERLKVKSKIQAQMQIPKGLGLRPHLLLALRLATFGLACASHKR